MSTNIDIQINILTNKNIHIYINIKLSASIENNATLTN